MRDEFTDKTKVAAYERSKGFCEHPHCRLPLRPGTYEFHHIVPAKWDGKATLENCQVLCKDCHKAYTRGYAPRMAKAERVRKRHLVGPKNSSRPLPGGRRSKWKRKIDGTVVRRQGK